MICRENIVYLHRYFIYCFMSTRATIKIKDGCAERWLYHHHDGYPEGVGKELCDILSGEVEWSLASVFTRLTEDEQYEPTDGVHGDEEYGYFINCGERELVGFPIDWRTGEWGQEVLRREYKDRRKENVAPFLIKVSTNFSGLNLIL